MVIFKGKKKYFFRRNRARHFSQPSIFNAKVNINYKLPPRFLKILFYLLIIFIVIYLLFFSRYFVVHEVMVEGNHFVSSDDIKSFIPENSNIFRLNIAATKKKIIAAKPEIKDLVIYRGIPNAIKIVVLERDGKIVWQSGSDLFLISSAGEVAEKIPLNEIPLNIPKVIDTKNLPTVIGAKLVSPNFVNFILTAYNTLYTEAGVKPLDFSVQETTFDINLQTDGGFYVKLNTLRSAETQISNLKKVLAEKRSDVHEYVDLRINGRAYYK